MPVSINYSDLEEALLAASASGVYENMTPYISRTTGAFHWPDFDGITGEALPDDVDDESKYVAVPHKNDLDLGRNLVFGFAEDHAPHLRDQIHDAFRRKGAYARFNDLLDRHGLLERWHEYERQATRDALVEWARDEGFVVVEPQASGQT